MIMEVHIQILSTHTNTTYTFFDEVCHKYNFEPLVTVGNLYIATTTTLDRLGPLLSELLYVCKLHYFTIKTTFDETMCYVTIND